MKVPPRGHQLDCETWSTGRQRESQKGRRKAECVGVIVHSLFPAYIPGTRSMWSSDLLAVGLRWSFD